MSLSKTMLDELTADCKTPQDVEKLYSQMLQHMINRALEGEMQAHLGHERHSKADGNPRNGKSRKTVARQWGHEAMGSDSIEKDREGKPWVQSSLTV